MKELKMLIFGDSITQTSEVEPDGSNYREGVHSNWPKFVPELLGTSNFKNYGFWGAHYADFDTEFYQHWLRNQITMALADPENADPDVIVFSLGTNDGRQTPMDDYATAMAANTLEELDTRYLYQAIRHSMWTIRKHYPNAKCFAATPIQRADREPMEEISGAIRAMAHRYNFIVIEAEWESGIVRDNEVWEGPGQFLQDGLHPNEAGQRKIAELYCSVIRRYL